MPEVTATLQQSDLDHFIGSEEVFRHPIIPGAVYTEGVRHVAKAGKAYWLIDEIATAQLNRQVRAEPFQVWRLQVDEISREAKLVCDDGNGRIVYQKRIPYTDFPLAEIKIYFAEGTMLLPSEY